ncbi:MAG TPA: hypothetical protein VJH33_03875 [Candidatus Paceibacterota bacterium]
MTKSEILLKPHGKPITLQPIQKFVVTDNFRIGTTVGTYTIVWVGPHFLKCFGHHTERSVPKRRVQGWLLKNDADDFSVIEALDEEETGNAKINLAHLFQTMELGEKAGFGFFDGRSNFCYKHSIMYDQLVAVRWWASGKAIHIAASSILSSYRWHRGLQVFGGA